MQWGSWRAAVILGCTFFLTACEPVGGGQACASWVRYETPQDMYNEAGLVLVGEVTGRDGEVEVPPGGPTATARAYSFDVEDVLKSTPDRDIAPGDTVRIAAMADGCSPDVEFDDGDQLEVDGRVIFFGREQHGTWMTLTPFQGVLAFPDGSQLPFEATASPWKSRSGSTMHP